MLSTEKPQDPSSSSSKASGLRGGQRDSDQITLQNQADPALGFTESQTTSFSIRDYVFASRRRDISTSWPFPRHSLQLCVKHGIRDFLPPFERASSVRAHCLIKPISQTERVITDSYSHDRELVLLDGEPNSPRAQFFSPSDDDLLRSSVKDNGRCFVEQDTSENFINDVCKVNATVTNCCNTERREPAPKNCRVILKPEAISETSRAEEIASSSAASDLMASKVCPVCKAFSSTSNTTLNAHIDQCLSMESATIIAVDNISKLMVKPRKKRLMEDIYATALTCTLEDLDRRNGTSWAKDLSLVAPTAEVNTEAKKPKLPQLDSRDEKTEGAVYVDSNGIKLRILSKFSDAPQVISRDVLRPRKTVFTEVGNGKIILIRKRKYFEATGSKKMKIKSRNKKLSSLKLSKDEIQSGPEVHSEECHLENVPPVQLSGEQDRAANCESATLLRWPCSKRSDSLKKVGKNDFHKRLEHLNTVTHMSVLEPRKPASAYTPSAANYLCVKNSKSPELKTVDFRANAVPNKDSQKKIFQGRPPQGTSTNVLHLKLSEASEALVSPPRSTAEEFCIGRKQKSHNSLKKIKGSSGSCHFPLKTRRISSFNESNYSTRKLHKHRSLLVGTHKRKKEFLFGNHSRQFRSAEDAVMAHRDEQATDQSLQRVKSHCQDAKPRNSQIRVKTSTDSCLGLDTVIRVSLEKADSCSVAPNNTIVDEDGLLLESNDKTRAANAGSETPMVQVSLDEQDKHTLDELEEHRGAESQAEATSAQEFRACLTSYRDHGTDIPRENTTKALESLIPNQGNKLSISKETSGSPASNASTISPSSSNDSHSKILDSEVASKSLTIQEKLSFPLPFMVENEEILGMPIERNQQVQIDSTTKEPQQLSDYQPCCCSCLSMKTGASSKPKSFPNLYIGPTISSSFGAYQGMRTDIANTPSLESPTGSILTRAGSDVGSRSPSSGTPTQSSSNFILRLMGKDLMVVPSEESIQHPKVHPPATCNISSVQGLPSPYGIASYANVPNHETFSFQAHTPFPPVTNLQVRNCRPTVQHSNINHKAYMTKEVIVINESSDTAFAPGVTFSPVPVSHTMFQRPFGYFPPQGHPLPKENGFVPSYPISQGSSLEVTAPLLPRPLVFQSPSGTHLNSQFYYPQSLR